MSDDLAKLAGLQEALKQGFKLVEPIKLSPAQPFIAGRAALVFASPHVLDASRDRAEFGFLAEPAQGISGPQPPHEDARVVAWFRPPIKDERYLVDFTCTPILGTFAAVGEAWAFTLMSGPSVSSTVPFGTGAQHLATLYESSSGDWSSFALFGTQAWGFQSCEFRRLAKS